jgi:Arc/MetJ-type ribon-helix-helix transcriptional regulator
MKSTVVCVRLKPDELAWLDKYVQGAAGYTSRSEYLRMLLHHEHDKRTGQKTPRRVFDSEWRNGRARQAKASDTSVQETEL